MRGRRKFSAAGRRRRTHQLRWGSAGQPTGGRAEQRRAQRARVLILKIKTHAEKRAREPQIGILAPCCFRLEQIPSPRWIKGGSRGQSRNKKGSGTDRRGAEGRGTTSPATNAATKNDGKQLVESKLKSRQARWKQSRRQRSQTTANHVRTCIAGRRIIGSIRILKLFC